MELQANARTLTNVLSVNKKYIVPRFQREYSWRKEEVNELWVDIASNIYFNSQSNEYILNEYFIGALVLVGQETSSTLLIVDGQQRLTTLTILLSSLCDKFKAIGENAVANSIYSNYISGTNDDGEEFFKLVNETPKPFFQKNIQYIDKEGESPDTEEERNLQSAYDDLLLNLSEDKLRETVGPNTDGFSYSDCLKAIRDQVLRYVKVIYITVNDEDEAHTIFETLNARGLNLSFVDLIKNKLFKKLSTIHPDDNAKTKWAKIRSTLASRNGVGSMETFVRHWWVSKYSYVSGENVYKSFIDKWRRDEIDAKEMIDELVSDAEIYLKISSPIESDFPEQEMKVILRSLQALKLFNIVQCRPFILSLFKARRDGKLKMVDFKKAMLSIERFHFLFNAVCSLRPSGIEGAYSKAARALILGGSTNVSNRKVITNLIEMLKKRKPESKVFHEKFLQLKFIDGFVKDKRLIQYILIRVELYLARYGEYIPDSLTLEHIFPQSEDDGSPYVGLIGNLLPLSKELNEMAGDKTIDQKLKVYRNSSFKIVKDFVSGFDGVDEDSMVWGYHEIALRTTHLSNLAYDHVWKMP